MPDHDFPSRRQPPREPHARTPDRPGRPPVRVASPPSSRPINAHAPDDDALEDRAETIPPPDPSLRFTVIAESGRYAVIDKPAGMLSVPGNGPERQVCVRSLAQERFSGAEGPMICHRLDMATSGLMVLALDPDAHRHLSMQFERRRVEKSYTGVVLGHLAEDRGTISLPMRPHWPSRPRQIIDREKGKDSITGFRVLARGHLSDGTPITRLDLQPHTGRTHQLRLHCAASRDEGGLGAPLLGDTLYGEHTTDTLAPRLLLHATHLAFADPATLRPVKFTSEPEF